MRPLIALFLLAFSLFPETATAKKKPPKIIPALANAKVIGVHCNKSSDCDGILTDLRNHLGKRFRVLKLVKTLEPDGKISFPGLDRCDLEIDVKTTMDYGSYYDEYNGDLDPQDTEDLDATIWDHHTGKAIHTVSGTRTQYSDLDEVYGMAVPDENIWRFFLLHSGMAVEACRRPVTYLRDSQELTSSAGALQGDDLKTWARFEEFCKKNGLGPAAPPAMAGATGPLPAGAPAKNKNGKLEHGVIPCQRVFVTGNQPYAVRWADKNLFGKTCMAPQTGRRDATAILDLEPNPGIKPVLFLKNVARAYLHDTATHNLLWSYAGDDPWDAVLAYASTCKGKNRFGVFGSPPLKWQCSRKELPFGLLAMPAGQRAKAAPVARVQGEPKPTTPPTKSSSPIPMAIHPRPVLGFWAGMSVKEFLQVMKPGTTSRENPPCDECAVIDMFGMQLLPTTYRALYEGMAEFYRDKLVRFVVSETVGTADDGSDARAEASAIAGDIEKRYGKPDERTRRCSAAGYTYDTVGKFWMLALAQGNLEWDDFWNFPQAASGPAASSAQDAARQARITFIGLSIGGATDENGSRRLNHASVTLMFGFDGVSEYDVAVRKARRSVF